MIDIDVSKFDLERLEGLFRECTPRLLVVTDGSLNGGNGGFGLSRFIATLQATTIHGMTPIVVHRMRQVGPAADGAFDDLEISRFDVLFLFGIETTGAALGAAALDRVKRFMQAGGGVFATGDHEDLGTGMCGQIPRVRAMRYWELSDTPHVSDGRRLTTNLAGADRVYEFNDQADAAPQRLYANYAIGSDYRLLAPWPPSTNRVRAPHPLVRMADGSALDVYPDHPHEGECRIPIDLTTTFSLDGVDVAEWPGGRWFGFARPRAVAYTMSAGNGFNSGPTGPKSAVEPRSFVSIAAYDGQVGTVGRVVTDATWHHYVNVNLDGMLIGGLPNANLVRIQRFWSNMAVWLMPERTRRCLLPWVVIKVLRTHPIAEEIRIPADVDLRADELRTIGLAMASAIDDVSGHTGDVIGVMGVDVMADVLAAVIGGKGPDGIDDDDLDLPTDEATVDLVAAVLGRYVVETVRTTAAEGLEHVDDQFERDIRRLAPPVVKEIVANRRAEVDRARRGLDVLERAALAGSRRARELATAR